MGGSILLDDDVQAWIDQLTGGDEWPDTMPGGRGGRTGRGRQAHRCHGAASPASPDLHDTPPGGTEDDPYMVAGAVLVVGVAADGPAPVGDATGTVVALFYLAWATSRQPAFDPYKPDDDEEEPVDYDGEPDERDDFDPDDDVVPAPFEANDGAFYVDPNPWNDCDEYDRCLAAVSGVGSLL